MDDLLREFLTETNESIAQLDVELVRLEQTPNDPELLSSIFRLVHTVKGTCGFLGLPRLEKVAHAAENVLGKFRDGQLHVTTTAVSLILTVIDRIKELLAVLEETEAEAPGDDSQLIAALNAMSEGKEVDLFSLGIVQAAASEGEAPVAAAASDAPSSPAVTFEGEAPVDELGFTPVRAEQTGQNIAPSEPPPAAAPAPDAKKEAAASGEAAHKEPAVSSQTIRVSVDQLETLMVIASELVLTRNQLMHT